MALISTHAGATFTPVLFFSLLMIDIISDVLVTRLQD
jgi:hypothetical protein